MVQSFWEALSPAELDRYDAAVAASTSNAAQVRRARDLQLNGCATRPGWRGEQYQLVDPENRLVAAELERRWEQALRALHQGEEEAANGTGTMPEPTTAELRREWDESHPALRQLWDEGKLTNVRKKELLRAFRQSGVAATRHGSV